METQLTENTTIDGNRFYEVVGELCDISEQVSRRSDYFSSCFEVLGQYLGAGAGILNVRVGPRTLERSYEKVAGSFESWQMELDSLLLRVQTDDVSLIQEFRRPGEDQLYFIVVAPVLSAGGKPFGGIGFVVPDSSRQSAKLKLSLLAQLLMLVVLGVPKEEQATESDSNGNKALKSVVKAADYKNIKQLCFAIVNSLCNKLGCEQVAIGLAGETDVKLVAVSGLSVLPKGTPGMQAIQQAMATCMDRNEVTVTQNPGQLIDQCDTSICKVHEFWQKMTGGSCLATLPLRIGGNCVAVLALRRKPTNPFMPEDIKRAQVLGESFAPALPLVDRASRTAFRHCRDSFFQFLRKWYGWHGLGKKLAAAAIFFFSMWVIFGTTEYQVIAPCRISSNNVSTVSSPSDALINEVSIQPGQFVNEGDLLVSFDKRELLTERNRIVTQIASTRIEANSHLQHKQPQDAFLLQSKLAVLQAELQLIEQKISRMELRSVCSGVVLSTDISQRVGQYVKKGEPLFEIAGDDQWHLEIETPEENVRHVSVDQAVTFQSLARPDRVLDCKIIAISPSSEVVDNKNVVVVEAAMQNRERWMKLGMEGFARIETGSKPVWWVYLHPIVDYSRLRLWL